VYEALREAGANFSVAHAGHYAINAMRLEKAYRAWGHELSTDETPLEAGLGFAVDWETQFLGKEALLEQKSAGARKRLVAFGYVKNPSGEGKMTSKAIRAASFHLLNDGRRYEAKPYLRSPYDPMREKMQ